MPLLVTPESPAPATARRGKRERLFRLWFAFFRNQGDRGIDNAMRLGPVATRLSSPGSDCLLSAACIFAALKFPFDRDYHVEPPDPCTT